MLKAKSLQATSRLTDAKGRVVAAFKTEFQLIVSVKIRLISRMENHKSKHKSG